MTIVENGLVEIDDSSIVTVSIKCRCNKKYANNNHSI